MDKDSGGWISVRSGAQGGQSYSTSYNFWLGNETQYERRSADVFCCVATASSVVVYTHEIGDDSDELYVYR